MFLFWILGAYVLTRSPRSAVSLLAVGAQFSAALYLLRQGMIANAQTLGEWFPWARTLSWAADVAPLQWYWVTALLLREQRGPVFVQRIAYSLGVLFTIATTCFVVSEYVDDWLHAWSQVHLAPPGWPSSELFVLPDGPLIAGTLWLLAATATAAAVNVWICLRSVETPELRRRFGWLFASALLFVAGANSIGIVNWSAGHPGPVPQWIGHSLLATGMMVMAWNVSAYSLLFKGHAVTAADFFYTLTALLAVCVLYGAVMVFSGPAYSFQLLSLGAITLTLVILSHAFVDLARRMLDRFFFQEDVQNLRWRLTTVIQAASRATDINALLAEAQTEVAEVASDRMRALSEEALRRLNSPAALAHCGLIALLPATLSIDAASTATPLEQARALREVLVLAIERLKPPDGEHGLGSPAGLQYNILREEYLQGLLNKQIMARHSISEGTFHRNRREAIGTLAQELQAQEQQLAAKLTPSGSPADFSGS
jgi:hypothetical protein